MNRKPFRSSPVISESTTQMCKGFDNAFLQAFRNTMKLASSLFPNQWRLLASSPQLYLQSFIFSTGNSSISSSNPCLFTLPLPLSLSHTLLFSLHYKVSNFASISEPSDICFSSRYFKLLAHFIHHSEADWNPFLPGKKFPPLEPLFTYKSLELWVR